jgi:uncharacterized surface protein with fasciclin (FAS1) repeats
MKTTNFNLFGTLRGFTLVALLLVGTISCDNQEIDDVMDANTANSSFEKSMESSSKSSNAAPAPGNTPIAGIAVAAGFNELVSALIYVDKELNAGLVNLFANGKDQYTVFAPTDAAFKDLYKALGVDEISDLPATLVLDVLKYHVLEGRRAANSVVPKTGTKEITTLLGAKFYVNTDGMIKAIGNTATIKAANISASNGIIHVVDAVLLPIN